LVIGNLSNSELKTVNSKLRIAVLAGGIGTERDVSIQSGKCVAQALTEAGFNVIPADIRPDYLDILQDGSVDLFFPALHGQFGEDGRLQQILEDRSLLYAGSGPEASQLTLLWAAKEALKKAIGTRTLPGFLEVKLSGAATDKDGEVGDYFVFDFNLPDSITSRAMHTFSVAALFYEKHVLAFTGVAEQCYDIVRKGTQIYDLL